MAVNVRSGRVTVIAIVKGMICTFERIRDMLLHLPEWSRFGEAASGIIRSGRREKESLVAFVAECSSSSGHIVRNAEFDLVELLNTSHCVLEKAELDCGGEVICVWDHVLISPQLVTPIKDKGVSSSLPA